MKEVLKTMKITKPFIKLDEDIMKDIKIQKLVFNYGFEAFGIYITFLTLFRYYEEENYMINYKNTKILSRNSFGISETRLKNFIKTFVEIGLFNNFEKDGEKYFYSKRRQEDLLAQKELREKQIAAAKATNRKKYEKFSTDTPYR